MALRAGKKDPLLSSREESEFPILCETCLGPNIHIQMMKDKMGKECKICQRPFVTFRWKPDARSRYKKTEICQACAKIKNVCQTCMLDLQFNLPVQVRDSAILEKQEIPQSDVTREYYARQADQMIASGEFDWSGKIEPLQILKKVARTEPFYKRNQAHVCSFFVRGTCTRGETCPYRHEMPEEREEDLVKQNFKDRYYGTNDPVAKRMLSQLHGSTAKAASPAASDPTATTLWVGSVSPLITETDLRNAFYAFGEIKSIKLHQASSSAFVQYATHEQAARAYSSLSLCLTIKGVSLRLNWSKKTPSTPGLPSQDPRYSHPIVPLEVDPALVMAAPPPPLGKMFYPSMNPAAMGSRASDSPKPSPSALPALPSSSSSSSSSSSV